jgi:hypothetical protein
MFTAICNFACTALTHVTYVAKKCAKSVHQQKIVDILTYVLIVYQKHVTYVTRMMTRIMTYGIIILIACDRVNLKDLVSKFFFINTKQCSFSLKYEISSASMKASHPIVCIYGVKLFTRVCIFIRDIQ